MAVSNARKKINLFIRQDNTWRGLLRSYALDFTGCSSCMQLREDFGTEVLYELNNENGGITYTTTASCPVHGEGCQQLHELHLYIPYTVTRDLPGDLIGKYDLEVLWPEVDKYTLMAGDFRVGTELTV